MRLRVFIAAAPLIVAAFAGLPAKRVSAASHPDAAADFHTSDRCVACHNGLKTSSGEDVSIGYAWQASVMANSARDPYWQASIRRESIDHPDASAELQDECSTCHMPMQHLIDRASARKTEVFKRFPQVKDSKSFHPAADGVSCSVCHQIEKNGLGTDKTFSGNVAVASVANQDDRPEYGPFVIDTGHQLAMRTSTEGFVPTYAAHIRDSALCGSCHTLYTTARGAGGKAIGRLPEQMPYLEWLHSDYRDKQSCQDCHMPVVNEPVAVTAIYGQLRDGMHRHVFVGGNFLLQNLLDVHRDELGTQAQSNELKAASKNTMEFLRTQSARLGISGFSRRAGEIAFTVETTNLTGHKLPTAYPSRRAWLHVVVRDESGRILFESGALRPDGSIAGNVNDEDPLKFEPHHEVIEKGDEVEIFESILKDSQGHVTTGLLAGVDYLKDNRLLPAGFDKKTAQKDIAVVGEAADDPDFIAGHARTRYEVHTESSGPVHIVVELWYQPIGFRWAHNLEPYKAKEPQRFVGYYEDSAQQTSVILARAEIREP